MKNKKLPRWVPSGHPDIQKKIDEVRAAGEAKRKSQTVQESTQQESVSSEYENTPLSDNEAKFLKEHFNVDDVHALSDEAYSELYEELCSIEVSEVCKADDNGVPMNAYGETVADIVSYMGYEFLEGGKRATKIVNETNIQEQVFEEFDEVDYGGVVEDINPNDPFFIERKEKQQKFLKENFNINMDDIEALSEQAYGDLFEKLADIEIQEACKAVDEGGPNNPLSERGAIAASIVGLMSNKEFFQETTEPPKRPSRFSE